MSALSIQPPFPQFNDVDGQPLEDGYIWIGTVNLPAQTNPISVYWDAGLTIPAAQPIRTLGGYPANNGTPARLYVNSDYSILVQNKLGSMVYSAPAATERLSDVVLTGLNAADVQYDPAGTGAVTTTVQAKLRETVSVKDFGAVGDGVVDDTLAIQAAVDYCIQNGKALYIPQGTYMIYPVTHDPIYLSNITADGQGITIFGEGRGKSIFKQGPGQTTAGGRFTLMFYCWLDQPSSSGFDFGSFTFMDLTFDKNARSEPAPPPAPYDWEQAHIIQWAGNTVPSIGAVTFERCEFIDKVGACVNLSTSATEVRSIVVHDCQSTEHPTILTPGWGQRGCFEFGIDCQLGVMESVTCLYSQIEPVTASSPTRVRRYKVSNCKIDDLEFTDSGGYSYVDVVNTECKDNYLNRGMHSTITNSQFKVTGFFTPYSMKVSNCRITLPYDSGTNAVTSLYLRNPTGTAYITTADFDNCDFIIDSTDTSITPTGYGVIGAVSTLANKPTYTFSNCRFDSRLYGTCDSYRYGEFIFSNCVVAGKTSAFQAGSDATYYSRLVLNNCSFKNVTGNKLFLVRANATNYEVVVNGTYSSSEWQQSYSSSQSLANTYIGRPRLIGAAAPTTGTWFVGDRVWDNAPAAGGTEGWVCTTEGVPGTWKTFGTIAA